MNKKILRGVPKKTEEIPKSEECIRLEERQKFADELMIEIRREYEKALEAGKQAWSIYGSTLPAFYNGKVFAFGDAMRMICRKAGEK